LTARACGINLTAGLFIWFLTKGLEMSDSQIIQLLGIIYLAIGLGMLFAKNYLQDIVEGLTKYTATPWVVSILTAILGFALITRVGGSDGWSAFITIIGWAAFFKGMFGMVFPRLSQALVVRLVSLRWLVVLATWIVLLGGAFLTYVGFFVL
jgi:hypothetical protein